MLDISHFITSQIPPPQSNHNVTNSTANYLKKKDFKKLEDRITKRIMKNIDKLVTNIVKKKIRQSQLALREHNREGHKYHQCFACGT